MEVFRVAVAIHKEEKDGHIEVRDAFIMETLRIIQDVQELDMSAWEFADIMMDMFTNGIPDPNQPACVSVVSADGAVLTAAPRL